MKKSPKGSITVVAVTVVVAVVDPNEAGVTVAGKIVVIGFNI